MRIYNHQLRRTTLRMNRRILRCRIRKLSSLVPSHLSTRIQIQELQITRTNRHTCNTSTRCVLGLRIMTSNHYHSLIPRHPRRRSPILCSIINTTPRRQLTTLTLVQIQIITRHSIIHRRPTSTTTTRPLRSARNFLLCNSNLLAHTATVLHHLHLRHTSATTASFRFIYRHLLFRIQILIPIINTINSPRHTTTNIPERSSCNTI
nr:hypothetical protein [Cressdnaviricota sp.]